MRTYLDCYPCLLGQALEASRRAGADAEAQREILREVLKLLEGIPPQSVPPEINRVVHRLVREAMGNADPYEEAKWRSTDEALSLLPWMKRQVQDAPDRLEAAARFAIAGNIIDAIPGRQYDLREEIRRVLDKPLTINHLDGLRSALEAAEWVLYLADNAGETVCDRPLLELIEAPVTYAVKGSPVANDATLEDALAAGVDQEAKLMSTGSDAAGTLLETCSIGFRETFREAPMIIAKGQANYECLSELGPRVFFLLQAKCPVLARDVGVPTGSTILLQGQGNGGSGISCKGKEI